MPQNPTREQFAQLHQLLGRQLRMLGRLRDRLIARGYVPGDPYLQLVFDAYNALHALCVATHYATCAHAVCASGPANPLPIEEEMRHVGLEPTTR